MSFQNEKIWSISENQKAYYNCIIISIKTDCIHTYFFLSNPVNTSKIFLYQTFYYHFQSKKEIVLCIVLSKIAALLLLGGRISYFWFKIYLKYTLNNTCNITRQFQLVYFLTCISLIILNEVSMQNKENIVIVNIML